MTANYKLIDIDIASESIDICTVGTGDHPCACGHCIKYGDYNFAREWETALDDLEDFTATFLQRFKEIPYGYFDDEYLLPEEKEWEYDL
jgi:hypothetical protein